MRYHYDKKDGRTALALAHRGSAVGRHGGCKMPAIAYTDVAIVLLYLLALVLVCCVRLIRWLVGGAILLGGIALAFDAFVGWQSGASRHAAADLMLGVVGAFVGFLLLWYSSRRGDYAIR